MNDTVKHVFGREKQIMPREASVVLELNGVQYVPLFVADASDVYAKPGGGRVSGSLLRQCGALPVKAALWPRRDAP